MATDTRQRRHALLDQLDGDDLVAAQSYLEFLATAPGRDLQVEVSVEVETTVYDVNYDVKDAHLHASPRGDPDESEPVSVPNIWPKHVAPVQAVMDAAPDEDEELSAEERYKLTEATKRGSGIFHPHISHDDLGRILGA